MRCLVAAVLLVVAAAAVVWWLAGQGATGTNATAARESAAPMSHVQMMRERLYQELQPVRLANCTFQRFGEAHDGGYLLCANLLEAAEAAYSYGISGYDGWGCDVATQLRVPVHQYDCFDPTRPVCTSGDTRFHEECIAGEAMTDDARRVFDTLERQVSRNGDRGKRLVVKMDVEDSEWESLFRAPDGVLAQIDQLAIELHDVDSDMRKRLDTVLRLKQFFHVAHLHFNNHSCKDGLEPFPAYAYEVLFVSRRLAVLDEDQSPVLRPHPLDMPNDPARPDCQYAP